MDPRNASMAGGVTSAGCALATAAIVAGSLLEVPTIRGDLAIEPGPAMNEMVTGQLDPDEFHHRFLVARIFTLCPVRPGLFVMSLPDGTAVVPVWTTVRALRQAMGGYDWCDRTGEDLVALLPARVGVLVDAGTPHSRTIAPVARHG